MVITAYVSENNSIVIDPTVFIVSQNILGYSVKFEFQKQWDSELELMAVFKPVGEPQLLIKLDNDKKCFIPSQICKRFSKLGIGLRGIKKDEEGNIYCQLSSSLCYIPIKSAGSY